MYIVDDRADELVSQHEELQRAIRGSSVMLILPGHGTYLIVNLSLTMGWMGSSLAIYGILGSTKAILPYYLGISLFVVSVMSFIVYQVLRGRPAARRRMFVYSIVLSTTGVIAFTAALVAGDRSTVIAGGVGVLASLVAARCIAGPSYALLAAFLRAKRAYAEHVNAETSRVRRESAR